MSEHARRHRHNTRVTDTCHRSISHRSTIGVALSLLLLWLLARAPAALQELNLRSAPMAIRIGALVKVVRYEDGDSQAVQCATNVAHRHAATMVPSSTTPVDQAGGGAGSVQAVRIAASTRPCAIAADSVGPNVQAAVIKPAIHATSSMDSNSSAATLKRSRPVQATAASAAGALYIFDWGRARPQIFCT